MEPLGGQCPELGVGAVATVRSVVEGVRERRVTAVDVPALLQPLAVPVVRDERGAGVVAAGEDRRGLRAVQIRDAREESVHAVSRFDAGHRVVAPEQPVVTPSRLVRDRLQLRAGLAVEHGQVLGSVHDEALEVPEAVVAAAGRGVDVDEVVGELGGGIRRQRVVVTHLGTPRLLERRRPLPGDDLVPLVPREEHLREVRAEVVVAHAVVVVVRHARPDVPARQGDRTLLDQVAIPVGRGRGPRSGLHHQLAAPVAVEVVREELGVVRARADVLPERDAVQQLALERVGVHEHLTGVSDLGHVL